MFPRRCYGEKLGRPVSMCTHAPTHTRSLCRPSVLPVLQGLGEIYEAEYVQQAAGFTAPDKQEPMRRQAVALFKALCGKLDALSSFAFAPRPVVEELEVRAVVLGAQIVLGFKGH